MKVIKEGMQTVNVMRVICKACSAELEITSGDLKKASKGTTPLFTEAYRYECPCCHLPQYIAYNDLSETILLDLND